MKRYRIKVAAQAQLQMAEASRWWRANRLRNPTLLRQELTEVMGVIQVLPEAGPLYASTVHDDVHHVLLRRTGYSIYYVIDEPGQVITVLAFWHSARGAGPNL